MYDGPDDHEHRNCCERSLRRHHSREAEQGEKMMFLLSRSLSFQGDLFSHEPLWQHYFGLDGTPDLLEITAKLLTEKLGRVRSI